MTENDDNQTLSTQPYRGVRDFYPEEMYIQNFIRELMHETAEEYGYLEYNASLLEPKALYEEKSSEELVEEQMYSFEDRGERDVALRPEMTPTLARMMAEKHKELAFPVRWYSIPNVFRYERPQKGRLREHWQLNADLFGPDSADADAEIIMLSASLFLNAGADLDDFVIHINHRELTRVLFEEALGLDEESTAELRSLVDKYKKMDEDSFEDAAATLIDEQSDALIEFLQADTLDELISLAPALEDSAGATRLESVAEKLNTLGIINIAFDPTLVRGLDYYTGTVFEVFDAADDNNRALAGGGRYDKILSLFGDEQVPAVGVGIGDVTFRDFLETHELMPEYRSPTDITLCVIDEELITDAYAIAENLRDYGLHVSVDISGKSVGTQIKNADNEAVPFIACIGQDELEEQSIEIKELASGEETTFEDFEDDETLEAIAEHILSARESA